jgi:hypothetical protein
MVPGVVHLVFVGKALQLAVSAVNTVRAKVVSLCKHELEDEAAVFLQFLVAGLDHLSVAGRMSAGRDEVPFLFDLNQAHPAGADIGEAFVVAQGRKIDPVGQANIQDAIALFALTLFTVNV